MRVYIVPEGTIVMIHEKNSFFSKRLDKDLIFHKPDIKEQNTNSYVFNVESTEYYVYRKDVHLL